MGARDGQAIVYRGWTGGEYGDLDPVVADQNPRQMFTAKNMMLYRTGEIGPRPGLVDLGLTNAPTNDIAGMDTLAAGDGSGPFFWVMHVNGSDEANVRHARLTTGSFTSDYTGAAAALTGLTRPVPVGGSYGSGTILNLYEKGIYQLAHGATKTFTNISTTLGAGNAIGYATTRFVLNGSDGAKATGDSRLYFSDVFPGWGTFGSTEYYDVGAIEVSLIRPWRNGLLVGNNVGELWYITGVLGTQATIRRVTRGGAPAFESRGHVLKGAELVYMLPNASYPCHWNGAVHDEKKHLKFTGNTAVDDDGITPGFKVLPAPWSGVDDYAIFSGQSGDGAANRAILYQNGVHSYHTFEETISAHAVSMGDGAATNNQDWPFFVIASDDGNGDFWKWAPGQPYRYDRPGFTSDVDNSPGDNSSTPFDAYLHSPIHLTPAAEQVRVAKLIVNFRSYNTGSATANQMTAQVDAHYRWDEDAGAKSSTAQTWSEAGSSSSTSGSRRRWVVQVGDQGFGAGFQWKLTGIKGVAVESVIVVLSAETRRP